MMRTEHAARRDGPCTTCKAEETADRERHERHGGPPRRRALLRPRCLFPSAWPNSSSRCAPGPHAFSIFGLIGAGATVHIAVVRRLVRPFGSDSYVEARLCRSAGTNR